MGSGTDIAKETSKMIVMDDNFNSIVNGVLEGRVAYSNIRKITYFLISCGFAEVLFFCLSILFNMPVPLVAIQLLSIIMIQAIIIVLSQIITPILVQLLKIILQMKMLKRYTKWLNLNHL